MPSETVLEGLHKSKLQDSVQRHTALAMYEQENVRNHEPPNYSRLKTKVRRHIDQTMRTCNFRARSEVVERGEVTKSQKMEKSQRGEESWRMLSVGINWTMFERRLMQVQSRWGIWQQLRSLAKRTIVLSCTKSEGTDSRKDTLKKFRRQRRKSFWNRRPNCVPKFVYGKVYESVV